MTITITWIAGFVIVALASRQIGAFFARLKLPLITGFLFTGILVGPYGLDIISLDAARSLRFVDELALAFIAFAAGSELVLRQIKSRLKAIRYTTVGLVISTFCIGSLTFYLISEVIAFVKTMPAAHRAAVALLAGAILVARSPSSAIAVVNELQAKGPFAKTALGVTVIMDVVVITLFSVCASIAGTLLSEKGFDLRFFLVLAAELALSLAVGYLFSGVLRLILARRFPKAVKIVLILALGYGAYVLSIHVRNLTHAHLGIDILLEPMLICMAAGFLTANYSPYRAELMKVLHDISPVVYVAFFTLTGVSLRLDVLSHFWAIALLLFAVRLGAIFIGSFCGGVLAGDPMKSNKIAWMSYITQAGVGLGLAKEVSVEFPEWGAVFATILIAVIVLNQIIGPPFFKWALFLAKEARPRAEGAGHDEIRDAVIFGLEGESLALARLLQSNHWEVKIATPRKQYVRDMAAESEIEIHELPDIDLASLNILGIGHADSIVAMLSDEENFKLGELVYDHFGIRNFIVRLNHRSYFKRFHELGAVVVEPATAIVNLLDQFVRSPSAARLLLGMEAGREIIEFELRNEDLQGLTVRDLLLPLDIHILSIRRSGQLIVSVGFTRLQVGDWLTAVGLRTSLEQVMLLFGENREHALVHMVGRAASKKISMQEMDREVEAIIQSPDDQRRLRFERLIDGSTVLDLSEGMPYESFFKKVAGTIAGPVGVSEPLLFELLMEREKETSTVLRPDLAIPHIIIEGENVFHVLLARSREGIYFSDLAPQVRAIFVLVGTRDQRDAHLYALSAIAEMVQHPQFAERWLNARNETTLRNITKARRR